jgi:GT2 family glycosyltransferase
MRVSAIVPATNQPETLPACLEAIRTAEAPPEELIVVDHPAGAGPAAARNAGAQQATGDILVFVDSDVVVHADAFLRIRDAFADRPELSAVFGAYDDAPPAQGVVSAFRNLLHHHVHASSPGPAHTFWAGLGAVRRQTFIAHGGFDARRYARPSIEDVELGVRMTAAGARIELDPAIQGTHLKSWTLPEMIRTDFHRRGVPWVVLLCRQGGGGSMVLNLGWRHRMSALAVVAATVGLARGKPRVVATSASALVLLNRPFYALLYRRRGLADALVGVLLHAVHHLSGAAAVPAGVAVHIADRWRGGRAGGPGPQGQADQPEGPERS